MSTDHSAKPELITPVDHKAASEKYLDDAQAFFWDDDPTQVNLRFAAAQVHATLYAAEQTRLNTLAILYTAPGTGFGYDRLHKQLTEGVGL